MERTYVFDFDDTIAFCDARDFDSAVPDKELIAIINQLYKSGNKVIIATSRGNLSCSSLEERISKYYHKIETWLKDNHVCYSELSFNKDFGICYVDDKAITPEYFKKTFNLLKSGLSNVSVVRVGDVVIREDSSAYDNKHWYKEARRIGISTPKVISATPNTLILEYINGVKQYRHSSFAINCIHAFRKTPVDTSKNFDCYIERIVEHAEIYGDDLSENHISGLIEELHTISDEMNDNKSFCHGDLTLDNIIVADKEYLIDPNIQKFSSWLIDASKLLMSYRIHGIDETAFKNEMQGFSHLIEPLCRSHFLRLLKHAKQVSGLYELSLKEIKNEHRESKISRPSNWNHVLNF